MVASNAPGRVEGPGRAAPAVSAAREARCTHCTLPVPASHFEPGASHQFCCDGCRTVHRVLADGGLGDFYAVRDATATDARPAAPSGRSYEELDDPAFARLYVDDVGDGTLRAELVLQGIHCAACVWLLERLPELQGGVVSARVDFGRGLITVRWDPALTSLAAAARSIDRLGYPVHARQRGARERAARAEERDLLMRLGVAGASAGNVMLVAFALYSGSFAEMSAEWQGFFRWVSLVATLPAVLWSAGVYYRGALGALKAGSPHMDVPVSLGITVGFLYGAWNTVRGAGEIYFDSVTAVVFLLLVGRWVQRRQQRLARGAEELLHALAPSTARVVEGSTTRQVLVETVELGQVVEVRAGEPVPVDGEVLKGSSAVDRSLLTGESRPEDVAPGDAVHAGCLNLSGRLLLRADATGHRSRVGKLMRAVEASAARRAPIALLADRVAGWFVVAVLGLALVTFLGWSFVDPSRAIDHAVALLVVSCPCALGLATPLAVGSALGQAARRGLLIKGGDVLEALTARALILFDKTGTLTEGRLAVVGWEGPPRLQAVARDLEAHSNHPVARAVVAGLVAGPEGNPPRGVTEQLGAGVAGTTDAAPVAIGRLAFVEGRHGPLPAPLRSRHDQEAARGRTVVVVARGLGSDVSFGLVMLADRLRPEARDAIATLQASGHRVGLLSGDDPSTVAAVAADLGGLDGPVRGGVSPEDKLAVVEGARSDGTVVMVGDGVNDAAALAAASVGVAVAGGAEASLEAAHAFSTRQGLGPILELFAGARRTQRVIATAIGFSLLYNVVGVVLAMTGWIHPLAAAILMPLSSITVVTLAYRSPMFYASSDAPDAASAAALEAPVPRSGDAP